MTAWGVLLLLGARDAALLKQLLPFLWEAGELACRRVEADVGEMDGVVRGTDLGALCRVEHLGNKTEDSLLGL